jgi:hypothetical protein
VPRGGRAKATRRSNHSLDDDMKFAKPQPAVIDPAVRALTRNAVDKDISDYLSLLDSKAPERDIHAFLEGHSYFFNGMLRMYGASPLYSKIRLGSEYEVDFAFFDSGSYGPEWQLVELEAPSHRMFTASGDPSAALTHAIQQVRNWHAWLHDNLGYARGLLRHVGYPQGYVFLGRRRDLNEDTREKLRRLVYDHRSLMRIHTLDWFADAAASVRDGLLNDGSSGSWPVPMRAFSHADLAAGRPLEAIAFLENPHMLDNAHRYRTDRQAERDHLHPGDHE